ncbi:MAG: acetyl-CoA C-acyltransferase [Planctomycetota bacterium]|nr:MAG: acetyl-CoA C-acyltransferase [Planctomycetota bacterium]
MASKHAYIVAAHRSVMGRYLGGLSRLTAMQIGGQVAKAALESARVGGDAIDEVYVGQVIQAGCGQNPARQVALAAGIHDRISCCTVNTVCGSGLQAVMTADQVIRAGDAELVLAGGMESMSQCPFLIREMRTGHKFGDAKLLDAMQFDGLINIYDGDIMGCIAEETAEKAGVSRADQDAFAARSHQRAAAAEAAGKFAAERIAIEVRPGKEPLAVDETVRPEATAEALGALKPVFKSGGTITAGNASSLADGAAMVLVAGEDGLKKCDAQPLARIVAQATSGGPPRELFLAPIAAVRQVCEKAGWSLADVDLFELNEAFAAQSLADVRALELDEEKVNVNGGAIALGHPLGASGARVLTTLVHAMRDRGAKKGVAALCLGGGNAVAMAVESA